MPLAEAKICSALVIATIAPEKMISAATNMITGWNIQTSLDSIQPKIRFGFPSGTFNQNGLNFFSQDALSGLGARAFNGEFPSPGLAMAFSTSQ